MSESYEPRNLSEQLKDEQDRSLLSRPGQFPVDASGNRIANQVGTKPIKGYSKKHGELPLLNGAQRLARENGGRPKHWQLVKPVNLDGNRMRAGNPSEPMPSSHPSVDRLHGFHNPKTGKAVGTHIATDYKKYIAALNSSSTGNGRELTGTKQGQSKQSAVKTRQAVPKAQVKNLNKSNQPHQKAVPRTSTAAKTPAQSNSTVPRAVQRPQKQAKETTAAAIPKAQSKASVSPAVKKFQTEGRKMTQPATPIKGTTSTPSSSSSSSGSSQSNSSSGQNRSR